jgi:hypothetical protein
MRLDNGARNEVVKEGLRKGGFGKGLPEGFGEGLRRGASERGFGEGASEWAPRSLHRRACTEELAPKSLHRERAQTESSRVEAEPTYAGLLWTRARDDTIELRTVPPRRSRVRFFSRTT